MKKNYLIKLTVPDNATASDVIDYLKTAIKSDCGCRSPEDPMFHLNRESVTIKKVESYSKWFDKNRQRLIDASVQDAAVMLYNDFLEINL
jgi:hypothetical protein